MVPGVAAKACLLLVFAGIFPAQPVHAGTCDAWHETGRSDAGVMYRCQAGTRIPWFMIKTTFSVRPSELFEVINNYDEFEAFVPNVADSRILESNGDQQWVFHHLRFPALFTDLNYVIRSTCSGSHPESAYYRVEWQLDGRHFPGLDLTQGKVPEALAGFWDIRPGDGDSPTEAHYGVYSDPGGLAPAWLVTRVTERYVRQLIRAIRRHLYVLEGSAVSAPKKILPLAP